MAIAVLQNVGTILRHANATLQRIVHVDGEDPPIEKVHEKGDELIAALDKLGVGSAPVRESVKVVPSAEFMALSQSVMDDATAQLRPITKDDLPVQIGDIEELRKRIEELNSRLAVAIIR